MKGKVHTTIPRLASRLLAGALLPCAAMAGTIQVPVRLSYAILDQALAEQLFTGPNGTAEIYSDSIGCNLLELSEAAVGGTEAGQVRLSASLAARAGTPLGDKCRFARPWHGHIELFQAAAVETETDTISFRVVDSNLLNADGEDALPRFVRRWVHEHVHPRLNTVRIELKPAVAGIQELLDLAADSSATGTPDGSSRPLLELTGVQPMPDLLVAELAIQAADPPAAWERSDEPPFTEEELAEWDAAWQAWDGFATWLIKTLAISADAELTDALAATLLDARYDLRDALARGRRDADPVRELFLKSWKRLAPLVGDIQTGLPGNQAMRYATFVSAGDALEALDRLAPHLGMRLDRGALREMGRTLVPTVTDYQLRYDTAVDPELRALLGLEPEFDGSKEPFSILSWLIPSAWAATVDPELVHRLNQWVPRRRDVDAYLETMEQLLNAIALAERDKRKVPDRYLNLYDTLLRATAWQESCWRQYVEHQGELQTIRSSAGSVGLMQVNTHVWRGVYDIDGLMSDVSYNARAGNEILVHYLVDYAIRRGEHQHDGGADNLARATYATYNGGPGHLSRYRNSGTPTSLRKIDDAFWAKYRAIQAEGPLAVRSCLTG